MPYNRGLALASMIVSFCAVRAQGQIPTAQPVPSNEERIAEENQPPEAHHYASDYLRAANAKPAPYTRYTPGSCGQAIRAERRYWRLRRPDTLYRSPLLWRNAPPNVADFRSCLAKFDVATVDPADLLLLGTSYLHAEDDTHADAAFQRWLAFVVSTKPTQKGWAMLQIVKRYAETSPAHLTKAELMIAQMDAMGAAILPSRMLAHMFVVELARYTDSLALLKRHVSLVLELSKQLPNDSARMFSRPIALAYVGRADLEARSNEPDKARATLVEGSAVVEALWPSDVFFTD